jgi:hypothetical protein
MGKSESKYIDILVSLSLLFLVIEAVRASETSVYSKTARSYIPEDINLHYGFRKLIGSILSVLIRS